MIDRRELCSRLLAGAAALALGPGTARAAATQADATASAFEAARTLHPWTLGYEGLQADLPPLDLAMRGRLPATLRGTLYRNGPARHALGGVRYRHPFDGDGLLQAWRFDDAGLHHRARFVRTPKFVADSAAGRPVRVAFGTNPPGAEPIVSADALNVANTSVIAHGGELLALWEGGSATRVDPDTLDTRGAKTWAPEYAGMPFSAHPKREADGTLWNFGVSSRSGMLSVYRIGADGALKQAVTLPVPSIAMTHDFAVTERHLVFLLPPLVFERERVMAGETFLDSHVWKPELDMRVLVLEKDRLDVPIWLELPAGFVFHVGNAWEEPGSGVIRLDCVRSPDAWQATTGLKLLMRGAFELPPRGYARATLLALDLRQRRARQTVLEHAVEFPRTDPRLVGQRYRHVVYASRPDAGDDRPGYDGVMRLDLDSGAVDRFRYGAHVMAEEHVFVPDPAGRGGETDGWVIGTALDLRERAMLCSVFDARRLADGPIAQGRLARPLPLGLHASFVPAG